MQINFIAKLNSNFNFSLSFELSLPLLSNIPTTKPPNHVSSEGSTPDRKHILG